MLGRRGSIGRAYVRDRSRATTGHRPVVLLAFASVFVTTGCATVGLGSPTVTDRVTATPQHYEPREGVQGTASLEATRLQVEASKSCDLVEKPQIARNTVSERRNETPGRDWVFFGAGVLAAGGGTALLIDSSSTFASDKTSTDYNPYGPDAARAAGFALVGVGALLLVVPTVDLFRTSGKVETNEAVDGPPRVVKEQVSCPSKPAVGSSVAVAVGSSSFPVGQLGPDGKLVINLVDAIPPTAVTGTGAPTTGAVTVDGKSVGSIPIASVRVAHEEAAWKSLDRGRCAEPSSTEACKEVEAFLKSFPGGQHEAEVRQTLTTAQPKLERLQDEKDWGAASSSACSRPKEESACEGVERYLSQRPAGVHAADAKKLTRDAAPVIARLRAQREARERAEAQREAAERVAAQRARAGRDACVSNCESGADAKCAGLPDRGLVGQKSLCLSETLKKCCAACGTSVNKINFSMCEH